MRLLYRGSTSLCVELINDSPYYSPRNYKVLVDGSYYKSFDTNVFSVFGLKPDTEYTVGIVPSEGDAGSIKVRTLGETAAIDVRSFGAIGDGVTDDTSAIQRAIMLTPEGGRLYFPEGDYLTLPLILKSRLTIELGRGARLIGSTERERYPVIPAIVPDMDGGEIPLVGFEGQERASYQSLLYASGAEDIAIVGEGEIDGQGDKGDWWEDFESFPAARPRVLLLNRSRGVTVHGVSFRNGPAWHIHPFYSDRVRFLDIRVEAPRVSPNTDAIDPESSDHVDIIGCRFSVGDDCVAIKSGKIDLANKYRTPADHHVIRNCLMEYGHGAVTLGSELGAGIDNLTVSQCFFRDTERGLRVKTRRGRGALSVVDDVVFRNIRMERVLTPIVINMWYNCVDPDAHDEYVWTREALPADGRTPSLGSFTFKDMVCTDSEIAACYCDGLPESPIREVVIENVEISMAADARPGVPLAAEFAREECKLGLYFDNVRKIRIKNVLLKGVDESKAMIARHYDEAEAEGLTVKK